MKLFTNLKFVVMLAALAAVPFAAGVYTESVLADNGEDHSQEVTQSEGEESQEGEQHDEQSSEGETYNYVAQAGDNYTLVARKAVQTYGLVNDVALSKAQIVFAETMLTQAAGSPQLNEGQDVTVQVSDVHSWVDKAGELTDEQKAAWEAYTVGVDFNTNHVGEVRE